MHESQRAGKALLVGIFVSVLPERVAKDLVCKVCTGYIQAPSVPQGLGENPEAEG